MYANLDDSSLKVLRNMFDCYDLDGDGVVSRTDLKLSSDLQTEAAVETVFQALKVSAGGDPHGLYLTYEEFAKGIMDFPFLLDQYKQELQSKDYSPGYNETDYYNVRNSFEPGDDMEFLTEKLREAIDLYSRPLGIEPHELATSNREDLVEILRLTLEQLRNRFKHEENLQLDVINGGIELYLLVRDLSRYHEEVTSDLRADLNEKQTFIDTLNMKYERLKENNEKLLYQVSILESNVDKTTKEHNEVLHEKYMLQSRLEIAETVKNNFDDYIDKIEETIVSKEKEISHLEKEIRQLSSFKKIQEMSAAAGRTTEDMKSCKLAQIKYRQSMPLGQKSVKQTSLKIDIKAEILSQQLKRKNEDIKFQASELDELELATKVYQKEISKLRDENIALHDTIRSLRFQLNEKRLMDRDSLSQYDKKLGDRGSNVSQSLFDELQLVRDKSAVIDSPKKRSILKSNSHSHVKSLSSDTPLERSSTKKPPVEKDKDRGYCSFF